MVTLTDAIVRLLTNPDPFALARTAVPPAPPAGRGLQK